MSQIAYFKRQAKNLFKDYQTKTPYIDSVDGNTYYKYEPKYFDIDSIILDFDRDEDNLSLMKAQHIITLMIGFSKWADLLKASEHELELAKLLFDNQDIIHIEDWKMYILGAENDNKTTFDPEARLEIFKQVFLKGGHFDNPFPDYRLNQTLSVVTESEKPRLVPKLNQNEQIMTLSKEDRKEFIEIANSVFESVMWRIEPCNPELTRKLWNAEHYVDEILTEDMLPISRDYALSLIEAVLVHYVIGLAEQADKMTEQSLS